jgi:two-component system, chemotaxis family, CheB/CheR fusion protein
VVEAALEGTSAAPPPSRTLAVETETDEQRFVQITGYPHRVEPASAEKQENDIDQVLLLVSDVSASVHEREAAEQARARSAQTSQETAAGATARQEDQIGTLTAKIHRLAAINQELRAANEDYGRTLLEMRHTIEDFQIDAEEMQAASEEVETLNEELQATNEELETLNEEQQATVEELHTANDDLEARSRELAEAALTQERMRQESERERARLAAILGEMGDAVVVVDATGRVLMTNTAYEQWFGPTTAGGGGSGGAGSSGTGGTGGTRQDGVSPAPALPAFADAQLRDEQGVPLPPADTPLQHAMRGETFSMIFTRVDAQNKQHTYEANGQPLPPEAGISDSAIVLIRNITDRSLRHLQEEFLSLASHELRSPVGTLTIALQLLERRLPPPEQDTTDVRRPLSAAMTSAESLTTLVSDLVDATRLRTGKLHLNPQPVDLVAVTRMAVESAKMLIPPDQPDQSGQRRPSGQSSRPRQQLVLTEGAPSLLVLGDPVRLKQILMNLLINAITYAPDSARIDVRVWPAADQAGVAELQVQDYGPGIPAANLPQIFSRFYRIARDEHTQGQVAGLGLGLYLVKELVSAHGGEITASAIEGKGATFTIHLPLLQAADQEPAARGR